MTEDILNDQDKVDTSRSIQIESKDDTENMNVKISTDFTKTIFINKTEQYLLSETHKC